MCLSPPPPPLKTPLRKISPHPPPGLPKSTDIRKFVNYGTTKRELNRRLIYECRCDERLKAKAEGFTRLAYTWLCGGLEHLKIEMRLIDERFASVISECVILTLKVRCRVVELVTVMLRKLNS